MLLSLRSGARRRKRTLSPEILKVSSEAPESHVIDYAASFIRRGRVVAIPTDTFYGICADPFNLYAV